MQEFNYARLTVRDSGSQLLMGVSEFKYFRESMPPILLNNLIGTQVTPEERIQIWQKVSLGVDDAKTEYVESFIIAGGKRRLIIEVHSRP